MSYTKKDVYRAFIRSEPLQAHQADCVKAVKIMLIKQDSFTIDELHMLMDKLFSRPDTSRYTSLVNVMVEMNYLIKKDKRYYPTAILKEFF